MLRKIQIDQLSVDMFVAEIPEDSACSMPRKKRGMIRDARIIQKFKDIGVDAVIIDTSKGLDVASEQPSTDSAFSQAHFDTSLDASLSLLALKTSVHYQELKLEWRTARAIFETSVRIISQSEAAIKHGHFLNTEYFEQASQAICRSVLRNKDALTWLGKMRHIDDYVYEHSVNTAVLMGIFCHARNMPLLEIEQCITGALLHDIGQMRIDPEHFAHDGPLTETQYREVKKHVSIGTQLLPEESLDSEIVGNIIREHHERIDGSGYPAGKTVEEISIYGKMFAIVDTYDALTNNRRHKDAIPSGFGMKSLLDEAGKTLDEELVHQFIKCLGIYPTGSLVKLSNATLAVVIAQNPEAPLRPLVRLIYNLKTDKFLIPQMLNLRSCLDKVKITGYEDPRKYRISVEEFAPEELDLELAES